MTSRGHIQISVELELAWGYHDLEERSKRLSKDRTAETWALDHFLDVCDQFEIPVTFDVVGHLLLDSCSATHSISYPDDWLAADPGSDVEGAPHYYAPDLVEKIQSASTDHEICTHTFTHVLCDEIEKEVLKEDLQYAQRLHEQIVGERARSLVPPRHRQVPYEVLPECGIEVIRQTIGEIPSNRARRFAWYFRRRHPVVEPQTKEGIVVSRTSPVQSLTAPYLPSGQEEAHPIFRLIPVSLRKRAHLAYVSDAINRVTERGSHAHLWTHLHDMANAHQLDVVEKTLQQIGTTPDVKTERMRDLRG